MSEEDKASESATTKQPSETPVIPDAVEGPPDLSRKPAILGKVGTTAPIKFSARPVAEVPKKRMSKI